MLKVGVGTVKVLLTIDGLSDEDWKHVTNATVFVKKDSIEEEIKNVTVNKEKRRIEFKLQTYLRKPIPLNHLKEI